MSFPYDYISDVLFDTQITNVGKPNSSNSLEIVFGAHNYRSVQII